MNDMHASNVLQITLQKPSVRYRLWPKVCGMVMYVQGWLLTSFFGRFKTLANETSDPQTENSNFQCPLHSFHRNELVKHEPYVATGSGDHLRPNTPSQTIQTASRVLARCHPFEQRSDEDVVLLSDLLVGLALCHTRQQQQLSAG